MLHYCLIVLATTEMGLTLYFTIMMVEVKLVELVSCGCLDIQMSLNLPLISRHEQGHRYAGVERPPRRQHQIHKKSTEYSGEVRP